MGARGQLPSNSKRADHEERSLAQWLKRQLSMFRSGGLSKERAAALQAAHPLVRVKMQSLQSEQVAMWKAKLQQLERFLEARGQLPSFSKLADHEERSLARWLKR